jgi:pre-mRNA-splicing factor SYF1
MASDDAVTVDSLKAYFPLTYPVPSPATHPDLLTPSDVTREEDLLRNPQSFRHWWTAINNAKDHFRSLQRSGQEKLDVSPEVAALLGPLASPLARITLQRLTYLYEGALVHFPGSFKLWRSYLAMRMGFVLGKLEGKKKAGGRKKFPEMKNNLEEERDELERWQGGLDGIVGWDEWKSLVATFERALMWLPKARIYPYPFTTRSF